MSKILQLVWLVPLFPLIGFLINGLGRKSMSKSLIGIVGSGMILASFVVSLLIFMEVRKGTTLVVNLFDFISYDKINIPFSFQVDQLSSVFLLIITGVGFLIHVYSTSYMHDEENDHFGRYFAYLNLFVFSMLLLVLGGNYLVMFIGWEGVGLCSYLLIGYWFKNDEYNYAANKAFIMNRIGDLAFLIALFWMISKTGSLTFSDVFSKASSLSKTDVTTITMLLSGFWHGANWTFIFWGFMHALFIMPSILFKTNRNNLDIAAQGRNLPSIKEFFFMGGTFSLTVFAWIFFRAESMQHAIKYISGIFSGSLFTRPDTIPKLLILFIFSFIIIEWLGREQQYAIKSIGLKKQVYRWCLYIFIVFLIGMFMYAAETPFIYFQF